MERQYLFTERAHLMCPDMTFGIAASVHGGFDAKKFGNVCRSCLWRILF